MDEFKSNHQMQLAQIPIEYHDSVYRKITNEILDASDFELLNGELRAVKEINDIYLVDHAWNVGSFDQVEQDAKSIPGLVSRFSFDLQKIDLELVNMVMEATQVDREIAIQALQNSDWQTLDAIQILTESLEQREGRESLEAALGHNPGSNISKTVQNFWNFSSFYNAGYNCWYITDEVGLAIQHSQDPNVKMIPFLTIKNGHIIGYSVFWPIKKISTGDLICRDALPAALQDQLHRQIYSNVVLGVANDSEKESLEAFKNFEMKLNSQKSVSLKRQYSEPTETIDFYIIQKLVLSKYGCVPWISRMYQLPLEFTEWNGHFVSDHECAWEIFDGSESIVTQNHAFLIHQLDIGSVFYLKRIEKIVSLYGGRRFTLDFLIKISREKDLEIYLSDQFYTRIAEEPDLVDGKWKSSVLKTKLWNDSQGKPTPSSQTFLKNYPNLPYQEIIDCIKCLIDVWNPKIDFIYVTFQLSKDNSPIIIDIGQIGDMDLSGHEFKKI